MPEVGRNASTHLLVVEDDDAVRRLLVSGLRRGGYEVEEASNGREALECLQTTSFALVITDLVMPEQEGIETIAAFRRQYPEMRVIAVSGAFGGEYLELAEMLGAHRTIAKPFRMESVLAAVREELNR